MMSAMREHLLQIGAVKNKTLYLEKKEPMIPQ